MFKNFLFVLKRFKTSSILNILGLSVAFTVFILIMMQVDYDYRFDRFHPDCDRIYRIDALNAVAEGKQAILPRPLAEAWFQSSPHIVAGALSAPFSEKALVGIEKNGSKFLSAENTLTVSPGFTKVFPFEMLEGTEAALEDPEAVAIPQSLAKKLFGSESATGKAFALYGRQVTVKGVYKDFPANTLLENCIYVPMNKEENINLFGNWNYHVYVRLDTPDAVPGLLETMEQTTRELLTKAWGNVSEQIGLQMTALPELHFTTDVSFDNSPKSSRQKILVIFSIAVLVIVIAGINFTNFSIALAPRRIRSINTQRILGSSVTRLRTVLAAEAVFICLTAYLISLALVYLVSQTPMAGLLDPDIYLPDYPVLLGTTALLAILVGVLSGLYPAFYMTALQPALAIKGSFGLSPRGRKMRNGLICIQFIASLALIISSLFMYLQNHYLKNIPLGFNKDQIIVTDLTQHIKKNYDVFANELRSFSGIEDVTYGQFLLNSSDQYMSWGRKYRDKDIQFSCFPVHPSFLQIMGITVSEGRDFREDDRLGTRGKYIFNERAKKEYDMQVNTMDQNDNEIVGFIPDIQFTTFYTLPTPMAFFVWGNENWGDQMQYAYIKVKAGSDFREAIQHVRNTLSKLDPEWTFNVSFFDEAIQQVYEKEQRLTLLITLFSAVAILISIIGVFGLVVFETAFRRKEISIRKVHGSSVGEILLLFNKSYLVLLGVCFLIACPVTYYAISKWLDNFAYKTPIHWWVFLLGGIAVLLITLLTVNSQSYRAATKNPTTALNSEG
ncbi:MAG: ABC transporter permease [Dysgonamonadaceae bacterium]|jgi:putative ABC transport system permease protein|nr:ABC transporter permease [Dysgonamonadaceae bacterium]